MTIHRSSKAGARDENDANEGVRLILGGEKTAISSLLWEYYSRSRIEIGREMSNYAPLVCERFQVVYS
jgi:uncharacterized protein YhfF